MAAHIDTIDLTDVLLLLEAALAEAKELDELVTETDPDVASGKQNNSGEKAAISRKFLHLRDVITAAASDAGMAYWAMKGHSDPRYWSEDSDDSATTD